jgi:hypothetical protein
MIVKVNYTYKYKTKVITVDENNVLMKLPQVNIPIEYDFEICIPLPFGLDCECEYSINQDCMMRDHYVAFNYFNLPAKLCAKRKRANKEITKIFNKYGSNCDHSPYPTKNNTKILILKKTNVKCDTSNCIRLRNKLYIVFANNVSYHNLEQIHDIPINISDVNLIPITEYNENISSYIFQSTNSLITLNELNLYETPLNNSSRGGKRFIFRSQDLANKLTQAIKTIDKYKENFIAVNEVFRYNKFSPSDKKFTAHYDTAFSNPNKNYQSKYSILIYLTKDINPTPTLKIFDEGNEHNIIVNQEYTCIIFDQKYLHEGIPYLNSDKIFIRSELIYDYSSNDKYYDSHLAQLFNSACYITKQSTENPELSHLIGPLFDKFNEIKNNNKVVNNKNQKNIIIGPLLLKTFRSISYVTNGTEYFFLPSNSLQDVATIILLDYYSGQFKYYGNKKLYIVESTLLSNENLTKEDIKTLLIENYFTKTEKAFDRTWFDLFNEVKPTYFDSCFYGAEFYGRDYKPTNYESSELISDLNYIRNNINSKLECHQGFSFYDMVILGNNISINHSNINITENQILFKSIGLKNLINFASCHSWSDYGLPNVTSCEGLCYGLPPIDYVYDSLYCLKIDQFRNGNIYKEKFISVVSTIQNLEINKINISGTSAYKECAKLFPQFVNIIKNDYKKEYNILENIICCSENYVSMQYINTIEKLWQVDIRIREIFQKCVTNKITSINNFAMRNCVLSILLQTKIDVDESFYNKIISYFSKYENC